eukprot:TRINITY_DN242_c8_g1_i1.p1 TRINITY_DN242_c8_g1~~TRINITY_DN242_c8_g1_i1.p1  ORF type:complete len:1258 (+),score=531.04 TRINITY_DN242_c8_g1_i1:47-3775(+)
MSLSSQLQQLKGPSSRPRRVSLLFDAKQSVNIDVEAAHQIGTEGLTELLKLDERFVPFEQTLFGHDGKNVERLLQTNEVNKRLDESVAAFLRLLSPFFLLRPAHKALEYLIRRYRINEFNVDSVMACVLPYHETNLFARMVQTLSIRKTKWSWLASVASSGCALSHSVLVEQCLHDATLIEFIGRLAQSAVDLQLGAKTLMSFYGATMTKVLGQAASVDSALIKRLLPFISAGLRPNALSEFKVASYMIVSRLCSRVPLTDELLEVLLTAVAASATPASVLPDALLCLCYVAQTQQRAPPLVLPDAAASSLLAQRAELVAAVHELSTRRQVAVEPLLAMLLTPAVLLRATAASSVEPETLERLLTAAPVGTLAAELASQLLGKVADALSLPAAAAEARAAAVRPAAWLLRVLDRLPYAAELDAAINRAAASQQPEQRAALLEFVNDTLRATRHQPSSASSSAASGDGGVEQASATLFFSLQSPLSQVRLQALKQLRPLAKRAAESDAASDAADAAETRRFVEQALVARLGDDDAAVLDELLRTLAGPLAAVVPPQLLFDRLTALVSDSAQDLSVRRLALRVLTGAAFVRHHGDAYAEQLVELLLPLLLVRPLARELHEDALRAMGRLVDLHVLLRCGSELQADAGLASRGSVPPADQQQQRLIGAQHTLTTRTDLQRTQLAVSALAEAVAAAGTEQQQQMDSATAALARLWRRYCDPLRPQPNGRLLVLLVVSRLLGDERVAGPVRLALIELVLGSVLDELGLLCRLPAAQATVDEAAAAANDDDKAQRVVLPKGSLKLLLRDDDGHARLRLLLMLLHAAIDALPVVDSLPRVVSSVLQAGSSEAVARMLAVPPAGTDVGSLELRSFAALVAMFAALSTAAAAAAAADGGRRAAGAAGGAQAVGLERLMQQLLARHLSGGTRLPRFMSFVVMLNTAAAVPKRRRAQATSSSSSWAAASVRALAVLAAFIDAQAPAADSDPAPDLQLLVPTLLVALQAASKAVRVAALHAVHQLQRAERRWQQTSSTRRRTVWPATAGAGNGDGWYAAGAAGTLLSAAQLAALLDALLAAKQELSDDGTHLTAVLGRLHDDAAALAAWLLSHAVAVDVPPATLGLVRAVAASTPADVLVPALFDYMSSSLEAPEAMCAARRELLVLLLQRFVSAEASSLYLASAAVAGGRSYLQRLVSLLRRAATASPDAAAAAGRFAAADAADAFVNEDADDAEPAADADAAAAAGLASCSL